MIEHDTEYFAAFSCCPVHLFSGSHTDVSGLFHQHMKPPGKSPESNLSVDRVGCSYDDSVQCFLTKHFIVIRIHRYPFKMFGSTLSLARICVTDGRQRHPLDFLSEDTGGMGKAHVSHAYDSDPESNLFFHDISPFISGVIGL